MKILNRLFKPVVLEGTRSELINLDERDFVPTTARYQNGFKVDVGGDGTIVGMLLEDDEWREFKNRVAGTVYSHCFKAIRKEGTTATDLHALL